MEFLNILNDFEREKINLFVEILDNPNREIELKSLQEKMQMSRYKVANLLESLDYDVKLLTEKRGIITNAKMVVPTRNLSRHTLSMLKKYYFELSPLRILMLEILDEGDFPTFQKIELKYAWPKTFFYQQKNKYDEIYQSFSTSYRIDPESNLRFFIYNAFAFFGGFPDRLDRLIKVLKDYTILNGLSNTQKFKAELMLWIVEKRVLNKKFVLEETIVINIELAKYATLDFLPITKKRLQKESAFIVQFYYYIGVFNVEKLSADDFKESEQKSFREITDVLSNGVSDVIVEEKGYEDSIKKFFNEISSQVILDKICFIQTDQFSLNIQYFAEVYPFLDSRVREMVDKISHQWLIPDRKRAYFNMMTSMLASKIPFTKNDKITLCIDFSGGPHVNSYILSLFKSYVNINVDVSNILTSKTDLYLSDQYIEYQLIDQVIWLKPPTPLDWAELGEKIVEIKHQKYQSAKK
ncbi:hypothetical protein [Liquorilactobacillus cacaonum]|uniref:Mga helix-turn-helix domain-containing protein n=1 Tax=Liquorilactobacillus cacaonum DSM 21116 TaxID=1423729 RepID=A0A0R2CW51_9LACO|nr:hypothetical protein [Liquorilactobacillus cacaonum]KRM92102.1 hypothetical protein FC80_GL000283 [Liquorilactobacillus cacaonum DSM 21116]